jgi:Spy/CpxP family protein refolding chaperone
MKKNILIFCTCFLAGSMLAWGQGQGQPAGMELTPWWDRPVVRNLGLSDDQLLQIRAITRESRDRLIQLRAAVRSAEAALADEFSEERINAANAEAAIERVVASRAELMRAISAMSLRVRQVLTYSQWQELRKRGTQRALPPPPKRQRGRGGAAN